jgi:hypothetical protein
LSSNCQTNLKNASKALFYLKFCSSKLFWNVRFEVPNDLTRPTRIMVFWNVTPYSLIDVY